MDKRQLTPTQLLKPLIVNEEIWKLFHEYVTGEKTRCVTRLTKCTPEELKREQGMYEVYDQLSNLKVTLLTEEKAKR